MSEPAVETPETETKATAIEPIVLRREAILPRERNGGLGAVALLCSLAGVASGFALATTILATQLARSEGRIVRRMALDKPVAFLGVELNELRHDGAHVTGVLENTAARQIGLKRGDVIVSFDGEKIDRRGELPALVRAEPIGHEAVIVVRRGDETLTFRPSLGMAINPR
jgi:hypothetical protein